MTNIEDYAMIGDCKTAALVSREGSIDWLCLPHFDSPACMASLLGTEENGRWSIKPQSKKMKVTRGYRKNTLILDTLFTSDEGEAQLTDFMPINEENSCIARIVKGIKGKMKFKMSFNPRFEYGDLIPLFLKRKEGLVVIKGSDQLLLKTSCPEIEVVDQMVVTTFEIFEGEEVSFLMTHSSSHNDIPEVMDVAKSLEKTHQFWNEWLKSCHLDDESKHPDIILRSVIVLKALTFQKTGSIVAAPTTSLPEENGGCRNWDYRFCWPRDAALAMRAVLNSTGQREEISAWREWIIRATAGLPSQMEVLYSLEGTRCMSEISLTWLKGFNNSTPVRVGNKASEQLQLDIYASVIEIFYLADKMEFPPMPECWDLARAILVHLEIVWKEPDEGIWEVRGPRKHFVDSKLMVWEAFNICIKAHDELGIEGPVEHWKKIRDQIYEDICTYGFNKKVNSFTQFYGSEEVDACLLRLAIRGFLPIDDERIISTVKKIEKDLVLEEGLLMRYKSNPEVEGLPETDDKAFLLCSAWLGEVYVMQGEMKKASNIFHKLISITNDVGLLAEQYDPVKKCQRGNFPQAFSHIALIRLEIALTRARKNQNKDLIP